MVGAVRWAAALLLGLGSTGCTPDLGGLGPAPNPNLGGSSTGVEPGSTTGAGATSPADTTADPSTSTTEGTTSSGSATTGASTDEGSTTSAEPTRLVDTELLARWYIDEAMMGKSPILLADSTASPLDLVMAYAGGQPQFVEFDGQLGLQWTSSGADGRALSPIAGSKIETELTDQPRATFELVLAVESVTGAMSRFFHIGTGSNGGDVSVGTDSTDRLQVRWGGSNVRAFTHDFDGSRQVLHVVLDTDQAQPEDRIIAYVNGSPIPLEGNAGGTPGLGAGLPLAQTSSLTLGNRSDGNRSFTGRLHYAAVYTTVLTPDEIMINADVLGLSDDSP